MLDSQTVEINTSVSKSDQMDHSQKIHQLENNLAAPIKFMGLPSGDAKFSLLDRMAHYKVPGVSMALIEDGEIAWAKTWGVKNSEQQTELTPDTLFQAASISKQVAALAALLINRDIYGRSLTVKQYVPITSNK